MTGRVWLYLTGAIIAVALIARGTLAVSAVNHASAALEAQSLGEQQQILGAYLTKQTDEHKLIRFAKQMKSQDPALLMMIADRAYEVNPKNRDIVVLASLFHPELKPKILELDPLYADESAR